MNHKRYGRDKNPAQQSLDAMNQPDYFDVPPDFPPDCASAYGQDTQGYWLEFNLYQQTLCFRWIPRGQFFMGAEKNEKGHCHNEDQHKVILSNGFWLAEITVTQALWQAVMNENPGHFQSGETNNFPVERVNWEEVEDFIAKLNQRYQALNFRLPWEAEWEYACRAGTGTAFNFKGEISLDRVNYRGSWDDLSNWEEKAKQATAIVKSYPANAWGLFEMHGNVWEWCADVWQEQLGTEMRIDPWLSEKEQKVELERDIEHVLRGGSWANGGKGVRSAIRGGGALDKRSLNVGFRLALGISL